MMIPTNIVLLLSGGLDSVTLLHDLVYQNCNVHCLPFNYGQTHAKELRLAKEHCKSLGVPWTEVELYRVRNLFQRCALTDGKSDTPIVPNRNAVMLHIAAALAQSNDAELVAYACNKDDAVVFPDCRPEFVEAMNRTLKIAEVHVEIVAPYITLTKREIVQRAKQLNVPIEKTWSCYKGTPEPCGECDACRKRAIAVA